MLRKKNIFQRLFSGDNTEKTGLSIAEKNAIRESLKSEYGLSIYEDSECDNEFIKEHYRRLSGDELARIDQIFQFVPQIAANSIQRKAINAAFKAATDQTFRVHLAAGMHLCRSHLTPGAYRAVGLSDATNQIKANAELFENNVSLSVSKASQIALGVFNAASIATGQYFMSQINSKLADLSASVDRLEKLIDVQRHARMKTATQELADLLEKTEFIILDTDKTNQAISQIQQIQSRASDEMNTCQELIHSETTSMKLYDKVKTLKEHIGRIGGKLFEYQSAAQLYSVATLLEVQLRNITDPDELRTYREQISRRVQQFKDDFKESYTKVQEYIDKSKDLNGKGNLQDKVSSAVSAISNLVNGKSAFPNYHGLNAFKFVDDSFALHQTEQKNEVGALVEEYFTPLNKNDALESPAEAINQYIDTVGKDIEFVRINGNYYTNLPEK